MMHTPSSHRTNAFHQKYEYLLCCVVHAISFEVVVLGSPFKTKTALHCEDSFV